MRIRSFLLLVIAAVALGIGIRFIGTEEFFRAWLTLLFVGYALAFGLSLLARILSWIVARFWK